MYMTDILSQIAGAIKPAKKPSEIRKELIEQNRQQIAQLKARIAELASQHGPLVNRIANDQQIESLRAGIRNLEVGIANLENGLPHMIAIEEAADRINAQVEQQERERQASDRVAHEAVVKAAALAEWLRVPGQTVAGFEAAWPSIARQIAMNAAVEAGSAESELKHRANPVAQYAQDFLNQRYGSGSRSGGVVIKPE